MTPGALPQDIIRRKRDGLALSADEIRFFIEGATRGSVSEGQIGAFTMAVFLRGMTIDEAADLALAMRELRPGSRLVSLPDRPLSVD